MSPKLMARLEVFIIVMLALVPLFLRLPYRVNIFLSWEGAYRISQGQLPFRDFGTPLGEAPAGCERLLLRYAIEGAQAPPADFTA